MIEKLGKLIRSAREKNSRLQRGQGLVEFALVLPVLILLVIGIMEFGYFFFVYSTVNTAAREAVRFGSATGDSGGVPYYQDCTGIREVATRIGRYANIQDGDVTIFYDDGPGTASLGNCGGGYDPDLGQRIVVQVQVDYNPIILFKDGGNPLTVIDAESARTIVKRLQVGE